MTPRQIQEHRPEDLLGPLNSVERKNAPALLYAAGKVDLAREGRRISVVGSRAASSEGLSRGTAIAEALVSRGVTVVSGLALGIDAAAHRAAIDRGGRTIAVIGTPLDQVYPRQNRHLQLEIMRGHLALSQFPTGHPFGRENWPRRNRTMALITDATIIVEAGEGSGTLHQGWEALRLGRPLFVHAAVAGNPELRWPAEMLRYGAHSFELEDLDALLEDVQERVRAEPLTL